jgi:hypothetical protein
MGLKHTHGYPGSTVEHDTVIRDCVDKDWRVSWFPCHAKVAKSW